MYDEHGEKEHLPGLGIESTEKACAFCRWLRLLWRKMSQEHRRGNALLGCSGRLVLSSLHREDSAH